MSTERLATLTFHYDKGGEQRSEEHVMLADLEANKLRMAILFGDEWVNFGRMSSALSSLLCTPISRIETQFKATNLRVNLRFGRDGVSRLDIRDRHRMLQLLSNEFDYLKREHAAQ